MKKVEGTSDSLIEAASVICGQLDARAVFVHADAMKDLSALSRLPSGVERFVTTCSPELFEALEEADCRVLQLPPLSLNRIDAIKMGVVIALSEGAITKEDTIVCLSGLSENEEIDTLIVFRLDQEKEMLLTSESQSELDGVDPKVFGTLLSLSLELAAEGREGKPRGGLFVLGDHDIVLQYSRQMVINPFHGYPEEQRNIMDPALRETLKEFSAIDGAFIIRGDGVVEAAGRHLNAAGDLALPPGLGSRHMAAAGITDVSTATSFVISESTGTVSIFKNGKIFMQIGKSQPTKGKKPKKTSK
ncbi:MAG: diadenylate cyclase [bacterium]